MYAQDYDELVIPFSTNGSSSGDAFIWDRLLQPYQKNDQILLCPSGAPSYVTYAYSAHVGGASPSPAGRSLASLNNPTSTPIIGECAGGAAFSDSASNVRGWSFVFIIPDDKGGQQARGIKYGSFANGVATGEKKWVLTAERNKAGLLKGNRHSEGANYVFADGHVKWMRYDTKVGDQFTPARKNLDYDSDGIMGGDPAARTTDIYD